MWDSCILLPNLTWLKQWKHLMTFCSTINYWFFLILPNITKNYIRVLRFLGWDYINNQKFLPKTSSDCFFFFHLSSERDVEITNNTRRSPSLAVRMENAIVSLSILDESLRNTSAVQTFSWRDFAKWSREIWIGVGTVLEWGNMEAWRVGEVQFV